MISGAKAIRQVLLIAVVCAAAQAYETGPPWGYTAAPGDNKTACIASGCHVGTPIADSGNVQILLTNSATTYVPGQTITIQVQITDPTKKAYGFELTARLASNTESQAGVFSPGSDGYTQVVCADGSSPASGSPCPAAFPVQDIEHTFNGYEASMRGPTKGSFTYQFSWTAPAAGKGSVIFYVAANCGIGDPPVVSPTDVYTSNLTVAAAAAPAISNVLNGASYLSTLAANTYATVYGANLSTVSFDTWSNSFTTNPDGTLAMPTSLDGTTIRVAGTPAYIVFVSPTQVNFITPNTTATGNGVPVALSVNGTPSASFSVTLQSGGLAPSFFTWQPSTSDYGKYLIAQHQATGTNVGKVGLFPGTAADFTTPAKPGEIIVLYGTAFGPTTPPIPNGIETDPTGSTLYRLSPTPTVTLGGVNCNVVFAGLAPGLSQVYQFDVTVPTSLTAADYPLLVTVSGIQSVSGLITVQP